ncbi:hypothetical protein G3I20_33780 [Streptomyces sp. SID8111]|uniref:hypothetical protein n=1 Tax=Streptomyces sp. SID8111 TaxID=2706100 RepID=UPI0013BFD48F|nr:hypothetical protein [Streptomyces sp. SID8111]NEC31441.1 hypothetical protein [Streptomyces sp. SID8111]
MSDELTSALRRLAADHEVPPGVPPARIRLRATRRARRRRATAALGMTAAAGCAVTALAFTLHPGTPAQAHRPPAADTGSGSPAPAPVATASASPATPAPLPDGEDVADGEEVSDGEDVLDLSRHTLTVDHRTMRVDPPSDDAALPAGSELTVAAKHAVKELPADALIKGGYDVKVPYVVELRATDRTAVYVGARAFDAKTSATLGGRLGWTALSPTDAKWFYAHIRVGDRIDVT